MHRYFEIIKEKDVTPVAFSIWQFLSRKSVILCWAAVVTSLLLFQSLRPQPFTSHPMLRQPKCPYLWHGGSPSHNGSCWCEFNGYCMCTPSLAIDAIIEVDNQSNGISIVLVRRKDEPRDKHAIVGGFVEVGETVEDAVIREVKEETNLDVSHIELFKIYSDPKRDARRHTVSAVYRGRVGGLSNLKVGDDAKGVDIMSLKHAVTLLDLAFDHKTILTDYIAKYHPELQ